MTLFGPRPFNRLTRDERLRACNQHCTLAYLKSDDMSNSLLRARFSLSKDDYQAVSGVIADAIKAEFIVPADEGQGRRNARYIPSWAKP